MKWGWLDIYPEPRPDNARPLLSIPLPERFTLWLGKHGAAVTWR